MLAKKHCRSNILLIKIKGEKVMKKFWAVLAFAFIFFCGLVVEAAPQPVAQTSPQSFPGTRMTTATMMHLDATVLAAANVTGPFWVVPNPQSPQCQIFLEKGLIFLGYPKAPSKQAASFVVEYTFTAEITPRQRLETFFTMDVTLNNKEKTRVWTGRASCSSKTSFNPNGFASSLVACDLSYLNKTAKKNVGFRELVSLHSAMTR